ncbi:hypothetical protein [Pseudoalteromonas sp. ASV78]|uniref:hypothetical protein n=1 Tax=Pseudoalteromonas sp. ASV78 TaxID=3397851 RepID=UPI0039FC8398
MSRQGLAAKAARKFKVMTVTDHVKLIDLVSCVCFLYWLLMLTKKTFVDIHVRFAQ